MLRRHPIRAVRPGESLRRATVWRRFAFGWITGGFFLISLVGHWFFGWLAYADEQTQHGFAITGYGYFVEMMRDTLENWQSEFLQLVWQVGGLAILLFIGSTQSNEGQHRLEEKVDAILKAVDPAKGGTIIAGIDDRYDRES